MLTDVPIRSRDADDHMVLATATSGDATLAVSKDEDLLVRGEYGGVRMVDAAASLRLQEEDAPP